LTITPSLRFAKASASADLPLAVGPATSATGGKILIIVTLIAADRLTRDAIFAASDVLGDANISASEWSWVDEGSAADIECRAAPIQLAIIRYALGSIEGVDVIVQPAEHREKKLLVADMDSTMIGQECLDELADYAGIKPEVAAITERAMRGELDFAASLKERVALLEGLGEATITQCLKERVRPNPGAESLVRTMRGRGAMTLMVSGGFTAFAEPVAEMLGFERVVANRFATSAGKLTGFVEGAIVDAHSKYTALEQARDELGISASEVLAIGDGANDKAMIEAAGLGVAYRAKPALAAVADARLDHNGLDALLWAQGIPRSEWVI
jgi:phosphoserine phosphatase